MWECGLKHNGETVELANDTSLPVWECGLKQMIVSVVYHLRQSLPVWECGLKLKSETDYTVCDVTPRVGVWIETFGRASSNP